MMRETLELQEARLAWWREARYGLLIHWGPASISGKEISWARMGHPFDFPGFEAVPAEEYDNLYQQFNPAAFDADAWMRLAKDAGMGYVVFVTKHHDGFSMWPTGLSEYSIANTPFQRDICREIAEAARRHGLKLGWYYSTRDWTHPDYLRDGNAKYNDFYHGQIRELLTDYRTIDMLWFDHVAGNWADYRFRELFEMIFDLQPGILVNNRAAKFIQPPQDEPDPAVRALVQGDFDTPEQQIGVFENDRPWESCVTILECADSGGWSHRPDGRTRTFAECLSMLVQCACGDGNFLLNIGPLPTGAIADDQKAVLRALGAWLGKHGHTIQGTRGGPFLNGVWGGSTFRDNMVYLHVLQWPAERLTLPLLRANIRSVRDSDGNAVAFEKTPTGVALGRPAGVADAVDTIIEIELDAPAVNEMRDGVPLSLEK